MGKTIIILIISLMIFGSCKTQDNMIDMSVVKEFNIERYLGKWYEIARFDHRFERGLVGVSATYSLGENNKIKVVNAGFKDSLDGERSEAIGKAKIPNMDIPAKLKVSFFWFFYGDYFVLDMDQNYQWAIVGSSSDNYLWILSRDANMDESLYQELLNKITKRGYNTDKLIRVIQ